MFQPSQYSEGAFPVARANRVSLTSTLSSGVPGVYMKSGVVLNDAMRGFLTELRTRLPFDIVVTSGVRTPWEQAAALAQDYNFGVYSQKGLVAEITAKSSRPSTAEMAAVIQDQVNRGLYLSRHMRGDALDFRVTGLSAGEIGQLRQQAAAMGGKVLDEGDHIHVERISGAFAQYLTMAKGALPLTIAVSVGVSVIGLALLWRYTRKH